MCLQPEQQALPGDGAPPPLVTSRAEVEAAVEVESDVRSVEGRGVAFRRDAVHRLIVAEVDHGAIT